MWALKLGPEPTLFLCLDEACDAEHYSAVAAHWAVENAVVNKVLVATLNDYSVSHWE